MSSPNSTNSDSSSHGSWEYQTPRGFGLIRPSFSAEFLNLNLKGDAKRNLIVNYLPQCFTDKALFNLFAPYGALHSVKIMREAKSGYSYGYGFVNFLCEEHAAEALNCVNGMAIANKRLKVSIARPPSDDIKDTNVYITHLPKSVTEEQLLSWFTPFGEIVQKNLLVDKVTKIPRGSAFVRFDRREQASAAIVALNNSVPNGASEPIRVKLAQDHGKQKAAYLAGFQDALHKRQPPRSLLFK